MIAGLEPLNREVFEAAMSLKIISRCGWELIILIWGCS